MLSSGGGGGGGGGGGVSVCVVWLWCWCCRGGCMMVVLGVGFCYFCCFFGPQGFGMKC